MRNPVNDLLKIVARQALNIAKVGLYIGGAIGVIALFFAGSRESVVVGTYAAGYFPILMVVMPLSLIVIFTNLAQESDEPLFDSSGDALSIMIPTGFFGGLFGALFSIVVTTNLLAIFGQVEIVELSKTLMTTIGFANIGIVAGLTAVAGFAMAIWLQAQSNG